MSLKTNSLSFLFTGYIDIGLNSFNSPIPTAWGGLPKLEAFYAAQADLTGGLDFMRTMTRIQEVQVQGNPMLGGPLPTFLGSLITLASLRVDNCGFSGRLPTEFGLLSESMRGILYLNTNAFTGMVPTEYGLLTNLVRFRVQENQLSGAFPTVVCDLYRLREIEQTYGDAAQCVPTSCCTRIF